MMRFFMYMSQRTLFYILIILMYIYFYFKVEVLKLLVIFLGILKMSTFLHYFIPSSNSHSSHDSWLSLNSRTLLLLLLYTYFYRQHSIIICILSKLIKLCFTVDFFLIFEGLFISHLFFSLGINPSPFPS